MDLEEAFTKTMVGVGEMDKQESDTWYGRILCGYEYASGLDTTYVIR